MVRDRRDNLTGDLLTWEPPAVRFDEPLVRAHTLNARFARAISLTLKECGLSREEVAERMSDWLGETVSRNMLDAYASEARESHQINLPRFAALIHATEDYRLLSLLPETFGFSVMPREYEEIVELWRLEETEREIARRKAALAAKWRGRR